MPGPKPFKIGGICKNGHVLTEENVRMEGTRIRCRICINEREGKIGPSKPKITLELGKFCSNEHLLTEITTYKYPNGKLVCKICRRNSSRKSKGLPEDTTPIEFWANPGRSGKTHCINGHELIEENVLIKIDGSKQCQICVMATRFKARAKKYGLTEIELKDLLEQQDNKCSICNIYTEDFHVDHDHKTGKLRGLLCENCNHGLGKFKDNIQILQNAIQYLSRP